eukprot:GHRQ01000450.1.p2 GENE.GHRQ01000450.1~~GHRQ01000450.1.p2  ORF type:complete len:301 (+),score=63.61 GHRQ01000450.1:162-1064(+)
MPRLPRGESDEPLRAQSASPVSEDPGSPHYPSVEDEELFLECADDFLDEDEQDDEEDQLEQEQAAGPEHSAGHSGSSDLQANAGTPDADLEQPAVAAASEAAAQLSDAEDAEPAAPVTGADVVRGTHVSHAHAAQGGPVWQDRNSQQVQRVLAAARHVTPRDAPKATMLERILDAQQAVMHLHEQRQRLVAANNTAHAQAQAAITAKGRADDNLRHAREQLQTRTVECDSLQTALQQSNLHVQELQQQCAAHQEQASAADGALAEVTDGVMQAVNQGLRGRNGRRRIGDAAPAAADAQGF